MSVAVSKGGPTQTITEVWGAGTSRIGWTRPSRQMKREDEKMNGFTDRHTYQ
jgi:hypothetical protein